MQNQINFSELLEKATTEPGIINKAYSAFHNYSVSNQWLAYFQCMIRNIPIGPIATYKAWNEKGRYVKSGEKAIELIMPVTRKATKIKDGQEEEITYAQFIPRRYWFALSQTAGNDIPLEPVPGWNKDKALESLNITETTFDRVNGNIQGYASERKIAVSPIAAMPHKTMFHEIAHVLLHTGEMAADSKELPRNEKELEAEGVAMICCAILNLPGIEEARGYIQNWYGQGSTIPEKVARRIIATANKIITAGATA